MLILYPATLLNLLIRLKSFCVESLGFSRYCIMSLHIMTILSLPFQFGHLLFLFLVWSLWLGLVIYLEEKRWEWASLSHSTFWGEGFRFFTVEYYIGCEFIIDNTLYWDMFSLYTYFGKSFFFIMYGCWILSNDFSASIEMMMWHLSFFLFTWYITLVDFQMPNHPCELGMDPTWSWCMVFFLHVIGFSLLIFC